MTQVTTNYINNSICLLHNKAHIMESDGNNAGLVNYSDYFIYNELFQELSACKFCPLHLKSAFKTILLYKKVSLSSNESINKKKNK